MKAVERFTAALKIFLWGLRIIWINSGKLGRLLNKNENSSIVVVAATVVIVVVVVTDVYSCTRSSSNVSWCVGAWLTGCEYGDRDVTYCSQTVRRDCYDVSIEQTCCAKCAAERDPLAAADCRYGNKASWCDPAQFQPTSCYTSANATCCETCSAYRTGTPGKTHHAHVWAALSGV